MPTYAYICKNCNHYFEDFQGINDPPIQECPECKSVPQRLISGGSGLIFKGSGFYETDYKRANSNSNGKKNGTNTKKSPSEEKVKTDD